MAAEHYGRLGFSQNGKLNHVPAFIDLSLDFDLQIREYTALKVIGPFVQGLIVANILPESWRDSVLGLRLESIDPNLVEIIVTENPNGTEVELYKEDLSGMLQPVYPEDLPRVIKLSGPDARFGIAGRKKEREISNSSIK